MTAERHSFPSSPPLPPLPVLRVLSVTAADWGLAAYAPRLHRRPRWRRLPGAAVPVPPSHAAPVRPAIGFPPLSFAV